MPGMATHWHTSPLAQVSHKLEHKALRLCCVERQYHGRMAHEWPARRMTYHSRRHSHEAVEVVAGVAVQAHDCVVSGQPLALVSVPNDPCACSVSRPGLACGQVRNAGYARCWHRGVGVLRGRLRASVPWQAPWQAHPTRAARTQEGSGWRAGHRRSRCQRRRACRQSQGEASRPSASAGRARVTCAAMLCTPGAVPASAGSAIVRLGEGLFQG